MTHLIRQMGHILISARDPAACAGDLAAIAGLRVTQQTGGMYFMSSNERRHEVVYTRGEPGVIAVGLEVIDVPSLEELMRRVKSEALRILDDKPLLPGIERAFRFVCPFGMVFEVHTPVERNQAPHYVGVGSRMKRFEHVNLRIADPRGFHDMLTSLFGMRLSDRTPNYELAFYRVADGYHHTIAAGQGTAGVHHYGFDAQSMQDVVRAADTLGISGRRLLWGPGRHGAGDNIFSYYHDPNGCIVEISIGLARIESDDLYQPRVWDLGPDSRIRNLWGPLPEPVYPRDRTLPFIEHWNRDTGAPTGRPVAAQA